MYSYEIDSIMRDNNYRIASEIFVRIMQNSSQVDHTKYSAYGNYYEMWTRDGYYWKFTIYNNYED